MQTFRVPGMVSSSDLLLIVDLPTGNNRLKR